MPIDQPANPEPAAARPRRVRWQFSLRAILGLTAVVAALMVVHVRWPQGGIWIVLLWPLFTLLFWTGAALVSLPIWFLAAYRPAPSLRAWPWMAIRAPLQVLRGRPPLWAGPVALGLSGLLTCALLAVTWRIWRQYGHFVGDLARFPAQNRPDWVTWANQWEILFQKAQLSDWTALAAAEAWSISRWWVLFGLLTVAGGLTARYASSANSAATSRPAAPPAHSALHRFLAFVPWFAALEFGLLTMSWLLHPYDFPQPNALFEPGETSGANLMGWQESLSAYWWQRTWLPTCLVGFVFFRRVLNFDRWWALILSLALVPAAISLSVIWSWLYLASYLNDPLRLGR
ncbi:MAG: hypothetical protein AB7O59_15865 [Pirellulales bacterium]